MEDNRNKSLALSKAYSYPDLRCGGCCRPIYWSGAWWGSRQWLIEAGHVGPAVPVQTLLLDVRISTPAAPKWGQLPA